MSKSEAGNIGVRQAAPENVESQHSDSVLAIVAIIFVPSLPLSNRPF